MFPSILRNVNNIDIFIVCISKHKVEEMSLIKNVTIKLVDIPFCSAEWK